MTPTVPARVRPHILLALTLAVGLLATSGVAAGQRTAVAPDVAVKAAFLYNFAKFAEWPALPPGAPIITCIVGDPAIASAFIETVRGQTINGHSLDVLQPPSAAGWRLCQLLFVADAELRQSASGLDGLKTSPVLTVSDGKDFARSGGIIELYIENGRMRFAINVNAAERAGLRLSSRLLGLAKVVRDGDGN